MARSQSSTFRIVLSLLFLGAAAAPAKTVLCVASSGHVAVENVRSFVCHPRAVGSGRSPASPVDDGCPLDCSDTRLSNGVAAQVEHDAQGVLGTGSIAGPAGMSRTPEVTSYRPSSWSLATVPLSRQSSSRSIILRC